MNNFTLWMQQAKEVTKKISDMMYVPPEDSTDREKILDDAISEEMLVETENESNSSSLKEMENKENISSTMKFRRNANGNGDARGLNRSKLETNAAATVEAARKYASKNFLWFDISVVGLVLLFIFSH